MSGVEPKTTSSELAYGACPHTKRVKHHDENDDRIRACHYCTECKTYWWGVMAKRLDEEGRAAWGPVGVWSWGGYGYHLPDSWVP